MASGRYEMGPEQGAEVGSGALIFSERPQEATEVMKQGFTDSAFGLEAALWLLCGERIGGAHTVGRRQS